MLSGEIHNLPQYTTPLIGREVEIADISDRLHDPHCRLLTLVGPGGIGKTRLAVEAASGQVQTFQNGIFFVALQPVASIDNVVRTVGSAIAFEFSVGSDPELQLHQHLYKEDSLLILDNVEHLLAGSDIFVALLAATTKLKLLVTSRESLNLHDEWLYHIDGLPYPDREPGRAAEAYEAVRLFAEHAGRAHHDFSLVDERIAVMDICRMVQGMPLGLELAAKWRRRLPCVEIARELKKSLAFLATDLRDVADRHRSMRAVFDHSWKLLSDEEQRAFMALSVFRGGFRRDAADQVGGASLAVLMSLVDKSMLKVSRSGRYEIHELQRQYVAERLEELPELKTAVRDQHSAYYTGFINRPVNDFLRAGNQETLTAIDAEVDNIRSAWNWTIERQNVGNMKQALIGLYWYAWMRSWHEEGERAFREAVTVLRQTEPTDENQIALGRALALLADMNIWLGRAAEASELVRESVAILRPLDARRDLALALGAQGWAAKAQQDWRRAKVLLEEAAILYEETGQNELRAFVCGQLGDIARVVGDYNAAEQWHQQAFDLGRQTRDQRTIAEELQNLGDLAWRQGQNSRARQFYEESLAIAQAAEIPYFITTAQRNLGIIAVIFGEHEAARDYFEESLRNAKADGKGPAIAWSHIHLADVMITQGEYEAAQAHHQKALEILPGIVDRGLCAAVRADRGRIALQTGAYADARRHHEASLALYREMRDRSGVINNLVSLARIALTGDDNDQAADYLVASLQSAIEEGSSPLLLHVLAGIAELFLKQDNLRDAVRLAALVVQHPASGAESTRIAEAILHMPEASLMAAKPVAVPDWDKYADLNRLSLQLVERLSSPPAQPLIEELSERELEVLQLVSAGKSNREIAQELTLAVGTVKSHLHNILQKLDASSRTQAVARARELRLL